MKLINKYPEDYTDPTLEGYELPVADMVVRAKFRDDPVNPTPLEPGKVKPLVALKPPFVQLHGVAVVFFMERAERPLVQHLEQTHPTICGPHPQQPPRPSFSPSQPQVSSDLCLTHLFCLGHRIYH